MNQQDLKTTIEAIPGEIVQVLGGLPEACTITMMGETLKPCRLSPGMPLHPLRDWHMSGSETLFSLLGKWLADVPVVSIADVLDTFGLEEAALLPLDPTDVETNFRLNILKAILEGNPVIQVVSPWKITDATDFIRRVAEFSAEQAELEDRQVPAFLIFDGDACPGITLLADRVLRLESWQSCSVEVIY